MISVIVTWHHTSGHKPPVQTEDPLTFTLSI